VVIHRGREGVPKKHAIVFMNPEATGKSRARKSFNPVHALVCEPPKKKKKRKKVYYPIFKEGGGLLQASSWGHEATACPQRKCAVW